MSLWECRDCGLRFRLPRESPLDAVEFYQEKYCQGFTTQCPSREELRRILDAGFQDTPKDYSSYIEVLNAIGLRPGDSILDFGCSWGYGSWQLRRAGFRVYSYEISRSRAEYAANKLDCEIVGEIAEVPEPVACFFSAHVIEHLPDPNVLWKAVLETMPQSGVVVCFTPNGDPYAETVYGKELYNRWWGRVHPLLLTRRSLEDMARRYGFTPYVFSSPYSVARLKSLREPKVVDGRELLLVARR